MASTEYRLIYETLVNAGVNGAQDRMNDLARSNYHLHSITLSAPGPLVDGCSDPAEILAVMVRTSDQDGKEA